MWRDAESSITDRSVQYLLPILGPVLLFLFSEANRADREEMLRVKFLGLSVECGVRSLCTRH